MKFCVVVASILVACLSVQTQSQLPPQVTGTCASIGFSNSCCPPEQSCQARDGNCKCNVECRRLRDCCDDVNCPENPRGCRDVGIRRCCNDAQDMGICTVFTENGPCSCDIACHQRKDCCPDARAIGCIPRNCTEAGLNPGCCSGSPSSCCVQLRGGRRCYCDSLCSINNDCCDDVPVQCAATLLSSTKMLTDMKQQLKAARAQQLRGSNRLHEGYGFRREGLDTDVTRKYSKRDQK